MTAPKLDEALVERLLALDGKRTQGRWSSDGPWVESDLEPRGPYRQTVCECMARLPGGPDAIHGRRAADAAFISSAPQAYGQLRAAMERVSQLEEALEQYGGHSPTCDIDRQPVSKRKCTCGFTEALTGELPRG
jgi:hypothetical protein